MSNKKKNLVLEMGSLINERYQVSSLIGEGGHAQVFAGVDTMIERPVAIKVLTQLNPGSKFYTSRLERFRREAKVAAKIKHSSAVTIYDMGVVGKKSMPFIVMELLSGHDLREEIERNGALGAERALKLISSALEALGEGHSLGVVHKDLKPANLFLVSPGTPKEDIRVVDFGVARLLDKSKELTGTGLISGTPTYLAPEYIETQDVTPAVDVYQIGLILAEMLTTRPVVESTSALNCIIKHRQGDLEVPVPLMQSPLGPILEKALELDPTDRYTNGDAFWEALNAVDPLDVPEMGPDTVRLPFSLARSSKTESTPIDALARALEGIAADEDATLVDDYEGSSAQLPGLATEPQPMLDLAPQDPFFAPIEEGEMTVLTDMKYTPKRPAVRRRWEGAYLLTLFLLIAGVTVLLSATLVGLWSISTQASDPLDIEEAYSAALEAYGDKNYARARDLLDPVLMTVEGQETMDGMAKGLELQASELLAICTHLDPSDPDEDRARALYGWILRQDGGFTMRADAPAPARALFEEVSETLKTRMIVPVVLDTLPSNARIYQGGQFIGRTPITFAFTAMDDPQIEVKAKFRGHQSQTVHVGPADKPRITTKLVKP